MERFSATLLFLFWNVFLRSSSVQATVTENITYNCLWDGVAAYIAVGRWVIQDTLDKWHDSISDGCDGPRLYLPTSPLFPGILDKNHHVIYISIGFSDFYEFQDLVDECIVIAGMEFLVTIPFLTDHPDGIPHYSLAVSLFYKRGRGDIPRPNFALPYIPIDEITTNEGSVVIRNGNDELNLSFIRKTDPCESINPMVRHEFDEYVDQDFQFGLSQPDFSFCDRHPIDNTFCTTSNSIKCEVHRSSPNVCQTSWKSPRKVSCENQVQIGNVTDGFRDMMLLGQGEIKVVASESYLGNFSIGLKYPCIEGLEQANHYSP
ncbi:hypothetical protein HOLleu_26692 [Holothuria leucospilota]|uniref:Uncharacterized protein n=1 Tax=Holothuria leucospilota TaxID=206669 RepID=A0A9Q1BP86_HOLLE|nr:hypothetical protein HOLleu_26692 [Holothuria leucospilota]